MNIRLTITGAAVALTLAACATGPQYGGGYGNSGYGDRSGYGNQQQACANCGIVTRIDTVASGRTAPTATGAVLGGLVGAIAGHELSDHTGGSKGNQNLSAVAGAAAGAYAGNKIQQNTTGNSYDIQVRMDDGRVVVVNQKDLGGVSENAYVRVVNGRVVLR